MGLVIRPAYAYADAVRELFAEYTQMLVAGDAAFQKYLDIQNYEHELENLADKYGEPWGRLCLAEWDGEIAGCVALRRLDVRRCELKRLYVRPKFRGRGIGRALTEEMIRAARELGYREMLLDTLPFLESALHMYRGMGFQEIGCYNDSPVETTIFMRLELNGI